MAFFPKDEYVPRRGVAMRVREPDVENLQGEHRDHKIANEVQTFVKADFVLNKALDKDKSSRSKVKTFDRRAGEHNVIAHTPQPVPKPIPRLRPDLPEPALRALHRSVERDEQFRSGAQDAMANCPGLVQKLSFQGKDKIHKHPAAPLPAKHPSDGITGFKGLGACSDSRIGGKQRVLKQEYDPLKLKFPIGGPGVGEERPQGLKCIPNPAGEPTAQEHFKYDDGVDLSQVMKKEIRHPHIHQFPDNFPNQDLPGFRGLGTSDTPVHPTGKKYLEANDHIYSNFDAYTKTTNASPLRKQQGGGNRSASGFGYHVESGVNDASVLSSNNARDVGASPSLNGYRSSSQLGCNDSSNLPPKSSMKAPHRVPPMKPATLANQDGHYHPSQSTYQFSPTPDRWMGGSDAARTNFH